MERLKRLFKGTRHNRPPQDAAALLQMPIDIILLIVDHLPQQSLYTLAQACYALQTIITDHRLIPIMFSQDRSQSLDFFGCLSKDLLDYLVCDKCIDFHSAIYQHFPRGPWREYQFNTMMPGCKRPKLCHLPCCHPSHLCSCYRRRTMSPYDQKQHVELVLTHTNPSLPLDDVVFRGMVRLNYRPGVGCRLPEIVPVPSPLSSKFHYTIISRVVQGRLLLFRQIRWIHTSPSDRNKVFSALHPFPCPVSKILGRPRRLDQALFRPHIDVYTKYGKITKCPCCLSEHGGWVGLSSGLERIWQDLGSEEDPVHACYTTMDIDQDKAEREAGRLVELFGPI